MAEGTQAESKISLVSKSDIRYEGFLHFINAEENTVGLKNVRMLGTEGRKGGGSLEVSPNDQMYDFIIFRGSDIKDLTVYETPQAVHRDPAIVSATPSSGGAARLNTNTNTTTTASNNNNNVPAPRGNSYAERAGARPTAPMTVQAGGNNNADRRDDRRFPAPQHQQQQQQQQQPHQHHGFYNQQHSSHSAGGGYRGGYSGSRGGRGGYGATRGGYGGGSSGFGGSARRVHTGQDFTAALGDAKESFQEQFDFEKSKEAFEKRRADFEKDKEEGRVAVGRSYDKKSFFDTISLESKEPKRQDREESKRADAETFGPDMVSSLRPFRRGRGGRGRYHTRF